MLKPDELRKLRHSRLAGRNRIGRARELSGETQVQLAAALGLTQSYISSIENSGYGDLPLETTRAFADHFGCAIEDLFPAKQGAVA